MNWDDFGIILWLSFQHKFRDTVNWYNLPYLREDLKLNYNFFQMNLNFNLNFRFWDEENISTFPYIPALLKFPPTSSPTRHISGSNCSTLIRNTVLLLPLYESILQWLSIYERIHKSKSCRRSNAPSNSCHHQYQTYNGVIYWFKWWTMPSMMMVHDLCFFRKTRW